MKKWFLLLGLTALVVSQTNECAAAEAFDNIPKMTIKGEASIFKPADQMEVSLGVVTSGDNAAKALDENNAKIRQIIVNLKALGLDSPDFKTGNFHVQPVYQKPPKGSEESSTDKISHYEALNTIQVKTQKIELADQILSAAVNAGANQITQVNFSLNNPQGYRGEAIKLAAHNALNDAGNLASATDIKIKRILDLSLDSWHNQPYPYTLAKRVEAGGAIQTDLANSEMMEPGETEIHVSVTMIFEIGQ